MVDSHGELMTSEPARGSVINHYRDLGPVAETELLRGLRADADGDDPEAAEKARLRLKEIELGAPSSLTPEAAGLEPESPWVVDKAKAEASRPTAAE
jgi:hypothetical protein